MRCVSKDGRESERYGPSFETPRRRARLLRMRSEIDSWRDSKLVVPGRSCASCNAQLRIGESRTTGGSMGLRQEGHPRCAIAHRGMTAIMS
jgi:hypothetical protein